MASSPILGLTSNRNADIDERKTAGHRQVDLRDGPSSGLQDAPGEHNR
jgi:hypothetical protein